MGKEATYILIFGIQITNILVRGMDTLHLKPFTILLLLVLRFQTKKRFLGLMNKATMVFPKENMKIVLGSTILQIHKKKNVIFSLL